MAPKVVDWDKANLAARQLGRDDDLRREPGPIVSLLMAGAPTVPNNGEWTAGWPFNPLLRLALAKTWYMMPTAFVGALLITILMRWFAPALVWGPLSLVIAFLGVCIASSLAMAWHMSRMRGLIHEEIFVTLLSPRDVVQALALLPWALALSWSVVFLFIDAALQVPWGRTSKPAELVGPLVVHLILRSVLFLVIRGAIAHVITVSVRQHLIQPAYDMAVWSASLRLMGMIVVHLLRVFWFVWVVVLGVLIVLMSALWLGMGGILVGLIVFPPLSILALIYLRVPSEFHPPPHLSPFHPFDSDFSPWRLLPAQRSN